MSLEDVAIVGAGPAGLLLANLLTEDGVAVRLFERRTTSHNESRATGLHFDSLVVLQRLNLLGEVLKRASILRGMRVYADARPAGFVRFHGDAAHLRNNVSISQAELEGLLAASLEQRGVQIEYGCTCEDYRQTERGIEVSLNRSGASTTIACKTLVGADGARSSVRKSMGASFQGFVDRNASFVIDCELDGEISADEMHFFVTAGSRLAVVPFAGGRLFKLSGYAPAGVDETGTTHDWIDTHAAQLTGGRVTVKTRGIASFYRLSNRVADAFCNGNVFILGDAAHLVQPNGGFGLNLAFQDAEELAWRLVCARRHGLHQSFLKAYDRERRPTAMQVSRHVMQRTTGLDFSELSRRSHESINPIDEVELEGYRPNHDRFVTRVSTLYEQRHPELRLHPVDAHRGRFTATTKALASGIEHIEVMVGTSPGSSPSAPVHVVLIAAGPGQEGNTVLYQPNGRVICSAPACSEESLRQALEGALRPEFEKAE